MENLLVIVTKMSVLVCLVSAVSLVVAQQQSSDSNYVTAAPSELHPDLTEIPHSRLGITASGSSQSYE